MTYKNVSQFSRQLSDKKKKNSAATMEFSPPTKFFLYGKTYTDFFA